MGTFVSTTVDFINTTKLKGMVDKQDIKHIVFSKF